jgi:phosphoribosyl 1,2-cyclic phosphodiesterase
MLIEAGDTRLLVDAGLPVVTLQRQLARAKLTVAPNAIVVTHSHGDHCRHAAELSEHFQAPLYVSEATRRSVRLGGRRAPRIFGPRAPFTIGPLTVTAMTVPHDAPQVSLRFDHDGRSAALATDLGEVPPGLIEHFAGCDVVLIESNHDGEMLRAGPYPYHLKKRVGGDHGHLSNAQTARFLRSLDRGVRTVVLMHLSQTNNTPELARDAAAEALADHSATLLLATQFGVTAVEALAASGPATVNAPRQLALF